MMGALTYLTSLTDEKISQNWTKKIYFPGATWSVYGIVREKALSSQEKQPQWK